jgi:uncharacterized membrane protein YeaQ/YmgE (transglycosylase-associated protein family)
MDVASESKGIWLSNMAKSANEGGFSGNRGDALALDAAVPVYSLEPASPLPILDLPKLTESVLQAFLERNRAMDQVTTVFTEWAHYLLIWIGFGTLVGLLAKAIFPGRREPGGAFATLIIGILGSVIGAGVLVFFSGVKVTPISVVGFPVALVGTMLILFTYRLLNGRGLFKDGFGGFRGRGAHRKVIVEE